METLKPCPTCGRFYKNAPDADPRPAAQPVAWLVSCPDDEIYGRGPDKLQFHPLAQHDIDNGYRAKPLYATPQPLTEGEPRPNWPAIYDDVAHTPDRDGELVNVTRETARLALSAIANQQAEEAYHNFLAAAHEIRAVLAYHLPKQESSSDQINRLAEFIMAEVPGEPSQNEGAVDTAIRCIRALLTEGEPSEAEVERASVAQESLQWAFNELSTIGYEGNEDIRHLDEIARSLAAKSKEEKK